ncbi:hypothetical protein HK098_002081 [Nowakowskiella sp. JEL0407]|nr:hypothetical protein HK098_002081 [Nowakowskiella sp. JEL0407]
MLEPRESSQPIHLEIVQAAKQCDIMATYNCLIRGVDVNEVDLQKKTILHHAVAGGDRVIVELLFQWNADINAQDENGKTPLHIAVECDNSEMAALLFAKRQMNICLKDNQDRTPMDMAIELDHPNIVSVLKRKSSFKEQPNPTHIDDAVKFSTTKKEKRTSTLSNNSNQNFSTSTIASYIPSFEQSPW